MRVVVMLTVPGTGWRAWAVRGTLGVLHAVDKLPLRPAAPHRAPVGR